MTEEINIEELKNIKNWCLDDLVEHPSKLEHVLETILSVVLSQQEQISALQEYVEEQKELEKGREADNYHRYQMGLSDFT